MKKHEHDHCEHEVKLCGKCDVVYCAKCDKEWGAECGLPHWGYPWYMPTTTITTGGTADVSNTTYTLSSGASCVHS